MLGLGLFILGILTPLLQLLLAYIYFKKSHIWARILNASLSDGVLEGAIGEHINLRTIKQISKARTFH